MKTNSNNQQVLADYNGAGIVQMFFVYGNYIDEVILMRTDGEVYQFVHDHLYSPVAVVNLSGVVLERYEYDAYGNPHILDADFSEDADGLSDCDNPYYFQGKRLDMLDDDSLQLMSWPYRDYSTYLGRWLQQEKLGMIPNDNTERNPFDVSQQYADEANFYIAFVGNPVSNIDPLALLTCGITEYKEPGWWVVGKHRGFVVNSNNIDFGPRTIFPLLGQCPWGGAGYPTASATNWELERRDLGFIMLPPGGVTVDLCCCASCADIKKCINSWCSYYNFGPYNLGHNCYTFVVEVKLRCCLKRKKP